MKFMKILKKAGGILLVIIGIFFFVSALKMIFVDNPKTKAALKDAVYVDAADTIDPENDGKTVIVCGTFELTEPAHDDELGLDFDSIRISSSKQTMKLTKSSSKKKEAMTDDEKKYGVLEWNSSFSSMPVSGQGKIGNYALSQDFIDDIMLTKTWEDYDKAALSSAGYTYVPDNTYTQKHFIEPSNQTTRSHKEYDVRYYYSAADFETGQTVTAIGIQDGQTLKSAPGITENLMKNKSIAILLNALFTRIAIKRGYYFSILSMRYPMPICVWMYCTPFFSGSSFFRNVAIKTLREATSLSEHRPQICWVI